MKRKREAGAQGCNSFDAKSIKIGKEVKKGIFVGWHVIHLLTLLFNYGAVCLSTAMSDSLSMNLVCSYY